MDFREQLSRATAKKASEDEQLANIRRGIGREDGEATRRAAAIPRIASLIATGLTARGILPHHEIVWREFVPKRGVFGRGVNERDNVVASFWARGLYANAHGDSRHSEYTVRGRVLLVTGKVASVDFTARGEGYISAGRISPPYRLVYAGTQGPTIREFDPQRDNSTIELSDLNVNGVERMLAELAVQYGLDPALFD